MVLGSEPPRPIWILRVFRRCSGYFDRALDWSVNRPIDSEWLLEVKTTGLGKFLLFYVTANEVRRSEDVEPQFHLYRFA